MDAGAKIFVAIWIFLVLKAIVKGKGSSPKSPPSPPRSAPPPVVLRRRPGGAPRQGQAKRKRNGKRKRTENGRNGKTNGLFHARERSAPELPPQGRKGSVLETHRRRGCEADGETWADGGRGCRPGS